MAIVIPKMTEEGQMNRAIVYYFVTQKKLQKKKKASQNHYYQTKEGQSLIRQQLEVQEILATWEVLDQLKQTQDCSCLQPRSQMLEPAENLKVTGQAKQVADCKFVQGSRKEVANGLSMMKSEWKIQQEQALHSTTQSVSQADDDQLEVISTRMTVVMSVSYLKQRRRANPVDHSMPPVGLKGLHQRTIAVSE